MLKRRLLTADVVYNGLGTPRMDGAVVVQGEGEAAQVVAVDGLARTRANFPDALLERAGFALSPPPVNAHTHLDLSSTPPFTGRYEAFVGHVLAHGRARGLAAAQAGVAELLASGVRVVGDIVAREEAMRWLLNEAPLAGVAYWEVLGPDPAQAETILAETKIKLAAWRRLERPGGMRLGLSPHSPHTVSAPLLKGLAELARREALPVQIHIAESPGENAFHKDGSGPLMAMMRPFVPDWQPSGLSPVMYLRALGALAARPTLVHMVHVSEDDVREVQRAGCAVVHCPRSNAALGCGRFPWALYMKHGVEVALGTDSKASSPSLSVVDELRAARALHGEAASSLALVRAGVKGGYRALGLTPPRLLRGDPARGLFVWPD